MVQRKIRKNVTSTDINEYDREDGFGLIKTLFIFPLVNMIEITTNFLNITPLSLLECYYKHN